MYDAFAEECLQQLPELEGTDWRECRRQLSRIYLAIIQFRLERDVITESSEAIVKAASYIRRLANVMEQYLFDLDEYEGSQNIQRARAYAFLAAEAVDLWCDLADEFSDTPAESKYHNIAYARMESALLYLASDYQINAYCAVDNLSDTLFLYPHDYKERDREIITYLQEALVALCKGSPAQCPSFLEYNLPQFETVVTARVSIIKNVADTVVRYCEWLRGEHEEVPTLESLNRIKNAIIDNTEFGIGGLFADIRHLLELLKHAVLASSPLCLYQMLPRPSLIDAAVAQRYENYLRDRASTRPFVWPSASKYLRDALPGPQKDGIVVVPTGSGKSFIAELACSQAMLSGWVLYLAPTNALVHQIQRDLTVAFKHFDGVQIISFIGGEEYTTLSGESLGDTPDLMAVAVMTPEKCSMALRINPDAFSSCSLCIADEFHLINDQHRGITLDLCLSRVIAHAPNARLLLMSAMVANGDDVSRWIDSIRNNSGVDLVDSAWRPCRTMRSIAIVNRDDTEKPFKKAHSRLKGLPQRRKKEKFDAALGLLAGMLWQWEKDGDSTDYISIPLPASYIAKATRQKGKMYEGAAEWTGWKNSVAREIAKIFWRSSLSVLCFILTSKHHVFSSGEKSVDDNAGVELPETVTALIELATAELGVESIVGRLLKNGIGVHSSAMLDTEQSAVEMMFGNRNISLVYATPTLAQGLNLPADIVIVAGSSLGDPRNTDNVAGVNRENAVILNAFGRSGRAMVANHGLAILVSDAPFFGSISESINPRIVVDKYSLLGERDGVIRVDSPIRNFFESLRDELPDAFSLEELDLVAQLHGEGESDRIILQNTFGAFLSAGTARSLSVEDAVGRVRDIGAGLVDEHGMPDWLPTAAMKAGVNLLRCWRLWQNMDRLIHSDKIVEYKGVKDALDFLISSMKRLPPGDIRPMLPDSVRQMGTVLDRMLEAILPDDTSMQIPWETPKEWDLLWDEIGSLIWLYMSGERYAEIACRLLGLEASMISPSRKRGDAPLPAVFSFVGKVIHHLSIYAGTIVVLLEESELLNRINSDIELLPLSIRNGCCDRSSLGWFRFGYRNRLAAHAFSRILPVPENITEDVEIRNWVRERRKYWLKNEDEYSEEPAVLGCVRIILSSR